MNKNNQTNIPLYIGLLLLTVFLVYFIILKPLTFKNVFTFEPEKVEIVFNNKKIIDDKVTEEIIASINNLKAKELSISKEAIIDKTVEEMIGVEDDKDITFLKLDDYTLKVYRFKDYKNGNYDNPDVNVYFLKDKEELQKIINQLSILDKR